MENNWLFYAGVFIKHNWELNSNCAFSSIYMFKIHSINSCWVKQLIALSSCYHSVLILVNENKMCIWKVLLTISYLYEQNVEKEVPVSFWLKNIFYSPIKIPTWDASMQYNSYLFTNVGYNLFKYRENISFANKMVK